MRSRAALHEEGLADDDLAAEHRRFVRDGDAVAGLPVGRERVLVVVDFARAGQYY